MPPTLLKSEARPHKAFWEGPSMAPNGAGNTVPDYHEQFAAVYDTLYGHRDTVAEVDGACALLQLDHAGAARETILDFGCGTGSHALTFAERGFATTGFDTSPAMIAQARGKQPPLGAAPVRFVAGDFEAYCRTVHGAFDRVVSFFNVFNCIPSPGAMLHNLRLIFNCLRGGACGLVEVWNGAAVFLDAPRPDVRHYTKPDSTAPEIIRITVPEVDRIHQTCRLCYRVLALDRSIGSFTEFTSTHNLHFLTPVQYRHLFDMAGFDILDEFPKGSPGRPIDAHAWYIAYLLRKPS